MNLLDPNKALFKALQNILRPLFRLLVRKGIGYPAFTELAKQLYVEAAWREEQTRGGRITDSRLSTLTGIHRKEIKRLRAELDRPQLPSERKAGLAAQLAAQWLGHHHYLNTDGSPKALPYQSDDPQTPTFQQLVQSVTRDVHPRTLRDTLLEQGFLKEDAQGYLTLNMVGYVPDQSWEESLFFAGKNLGAHGATVVDNLLQQSPPQLDRAVYYYRLSAKSAEELEQWVREESLALLKRFNQRAAELQAQDKARGEGGHGVHFGTYFHREHEEPSP